MNWDYCTYVPMLYESCRITDGPVVELGVGLCSTPLLNALLTFGTAPRELYSLDDDASWLSLMRSRVSRDHHSFTHITDWVSQIAPFVDLMPSVAFIDHGDPKSILQSKQLRWDAIAAFEHHAEIIIIHDASNVLDLRNVGALSDRFKYTVLDEHTHPSTAWLSNKYAPDYLMQRSFPCLLQEQISTTERLHS